MKILRLVIFGFLLALAVGCNNEITEGKIVNVERIYWHEGCKYSFTVPTEGSLGFHNESVPGLCTSDDVSIIPDVPVGEKMWVYYVNTFSLGDRFLNKMEIHVHTLADINGGGWNHGKFGHGQTTVIE